MVLSSIEMAWSSSSSSSTLLAVAVLAALIAGAWCAPKMTFTVEKGSTAEKLELKVKYNKAGDELSELEMREHGSQEWRTMKNSGGVWKVESSKPLKGPFNFRFMSKKGMRGVFDDVVPTEFKAGTTYTPED